jgi:hypothetical protein
MRGNLKFQYTLAAANVYTPTSQVIQNSRVLVKSPLFFELKRCILAFAAFDLIVFNHINNYSTTEDKNRIV